MNFGLLKNNKVVCTCKYCGWEGMPWEQHDIYECLDWEKKTRTVRIVCPKCRTIDSIKSKEYDKIEDHSLLIRNYEKCKNLNF
jgi:phage FluMu protein Com